MAKILVVDDSASVLEIATAILSEAGHHVSISDRGDRVLQILETDEPDLLITDIYMPGVDGLQVIGEARRLCPNLPIIAMSAMTGKWSMLRVAKLLGARCALRKPFSQSDLLDTVKTALRKAELDRRTRGSKAGSARLKGEDHRSIA